MDDKKFNLLALLLGLVGILAFIAIVISLVSITRDTSPRINVDASRSSGTGDRASGVSGVSGGSGGSGAGSSASAGGASPGASVDVIMGSLDTVPGPSPRGRLNGKRVYTVALSSDYGSHEYLDKKGYLQGFGPGLVNLVCQEAGIDCRLVIDRPKNVWNSVSGQLATGGQGLHEGWYDASIGWYVTTYRSEVFAFSESYLKRPTAHFYVRKGESLFTSADSIRSKNIVFVNGWASDANCVATQVKAKLGKDQIFYADSASEAVKTLVDDKKWDAVFVTATTVEAAVQNNTIDQVSGSYWCMLKGNALITRKDSVLPALWNRGFNSAKANGKFKAYCDMANNLHGKEGI